ncbi:MerR family transcriptional regulator [Staphylococcus saprophyticus]|uniref:MerR family transcriptional regulator n=1 Tax=Staphylococcus TaxID=1279 RepID=UPI00076AF2DC|nr:MerR family transcriptional regulator [Staphylococcus saprophyticus]OEL01255.1 MerR family transcriptional regulator [Staphylococcus succinus]AMG21041.1 MerR family transcriptional regulator [Staphylococcus saprophyticus]MDK1673699.1 MerR family transcriptional regulator [Staphylococcus saprophyticus]MDW3785306.1 MerR family transcriptional regulator [Staphylococcus saprophyticus]MDW3804674.1 MerR family transcriptional regulator [Staphylococcus saprophyticus]
MKTKEVVELMEISQDTLRYYEKVGVIPPVDRDKNGYRVYKDNDLNWIYLVKHLRRAGVSIESLIEFCRLGQLSKDQYIQNQQKQVLNNQLDELNVKLKEVLNARDLLQYKIDNYDSHIAKIEAGAFDAENVERLWEKKINI